MPASTVTQVHMPITGCSHSLGFELRLALRLLLSTTSIQALPVNVLAVQGIHCRARGVCIIKVHEAEAPRLAAVILHASAT